MSLLVLLLFFILWNTQKNMQNDREFASYRVVSSFLVLSQADPRAASASAIPACFKKLTSHFLSFRKISVFQIFVIFRDIIGFENVLFYFNQSQSKITICN